MGPVADEHLRGKQHAEFAHARQQDNHRANTGKRQHVGCSQGRQERDVDLHASAPSSGERASRVRLTIALVLTAVIMPERQLPVFR